MHAHQRLQLNLHYAYNSYVSSMAGFPKAGFYLPVFWADEWGYMTDELADDWKGAIGFAISTGQNVQTAGLAGGLGLLGVALLATVVIAWRRGNTETEERAPLIKSVNSDY